MRVIRTLNVPVAAVVPLITPVDVFRLMPAGSDPAVLDHENGAVPPAAASVTEYGDPAVPSGSDEVVIVNPGTTVSENPFVGDCADVALSRTWAVKLKIPDSAGAPVRTPFVLSDTPPGKAPAVTDHE